jgi:predicted nucleic-acid-binding protein
VIGLDTNVLVRYLTQDDAAQSRRANKLISDAVAEGEPLHLSTIVLCETVWVLRWAYRVGKADVLRALNQVLDTAQFSIEDGDLCRQALADYADGQGDFSDYLLGARNRRAGCSVTATFDRKLARSQLFRILR